MNKVEQARRASGITQQAAAAILGVSHPTYIKKEQNPSLMTFGDIMALGAEMDPTSRGILWRVNDEIASSEFEAREISQMTLGEFYGARNSERLKRELESAREIFFANGV